MDSTSPTTASIKVFDVPELLEKIISFMPDRDIFNRAHKVSRTWKATIVASPRLLRRSWQRKSNKSAISPSAFAKERFIDEPIYDGPVAVNSLFSSGRRLLTNDGILDSVFYNYTASDDRYLTKCDFWVSSRFRKEFVGHKRELVDQTWRSMQLCDPPITVAKLSVDVQWNLEEGEEIDVIVYDREGITMGLAYDTGVAVIRSSRVPQPTLDKTFEWYSFRLKFWIETYKMDLHDGWDQGDDPHDGGRYDQDGWGGGSGEDYGDDDESGGEEYEEAGGKGSDERENEEGDTEADDEDVREEEGSEDEGSGEDAHTGPGMEHEMSAKVFDVPELLEHIILSLPGYDILTSAQRVSRAWKASVDASPGIQRKLLRRRGDEPASSPIRSFLGENWIEEIPIYRSTVRFNPLLNGALSLYPGCSMEGGPEPIGLWPEGLYHCHYEIEVGYRADGNPAFSDRSDRSWRRIQVCDPPITVVSLYTKHIPHKIPGVPYLEDEEPAICAAVLDRDGVTMGLLFDTAAALLHNIDSFHPFVRMSFGIDMPDDLDDVMPGEDDTGDSDDASNSEEESDGKGRLGQGENAEETSLESTSVENADNEGGNGSGGDKSGKNAPAGTVESAESMIPKVVAIP
jgi:hypothetical protein